MKQSLSAIALFCAATVSAHAQSSVTLYGLIDTGLIYANNQLGHSSWQQVTSST
jgi:predicted porin